MSIVSSGDSLMAYQLADGQALWPQPVKVDGWIGDIVQHPAGIAMLPPRRKTKQLEAVPFVFMLTTTPGGKRERSASDRQEHSPAASTGESRER